MSAMSKPIQLGATIVLGVVLVGAVAAGLAYGDDLHEIFESRSSQKATERVQMQGVWMGMRLAPADVPSEFGQPTATKGVRVVEISERYGWRARQAGIVTGDILTSINSKKIADLSDLDSITKNLNVAGQVPLEILRWGQPVALRCRHFPAGWRPAIDHGPRSNLAARPAQPAITTGFGPGVGPGAGPMFFCPQHRQMWGQGQVHPHYRCPVCYGPLSKAP